MAMPSIFVSSGDGTGHGLLRGFVDWPAVKSAWTIQSSTTIDGNYWRSLDVARDRLEVPIVVAGDDTRTFIVVEGDTGNVLLKETGPGRTCRIQIERTSSSRLTAYIAFWDRDPNTASVGGLLALTIYTANSGQRAVSRKWLTRMPVRDLAVTQGVVFARIQNDVGGALDDVYMVALDAKTGDELWRADPVFDLIRDDKFFYATRAGTNQIIAFEPQQGKEAWATPAKVASGWEPDLVADEARVYWSGTTAVHAYDRLTGTEIWSHDFGNTVTARDGVIAQRPNAGPIYVVRTESYNAAAQKLWALDVTTGVPIWASGQLWKTPWSAPIWPGAATYQVIWGTEPGYAGLTALDPDTGAVAWFHVMAYEFIYWVAVANEGRGGYSTPLLG